MRKFLGFLCVFILPVSGALAQMDVNQIVEKANLVAYYGGADGSSDVSMIITDSQGRERKREFTILRYDVQDGGEQKFFVYFHKPADVSRMVYMVWKHIGRDDDRWLYLPALDLVRRIAAGDKRSSFVGSHFVYEDVSGRGVTADSHQIIEETEEYYKIRNTPLDPQGMEFAYYDVWVRKSDFLPSRSEYYNEQGDLIRSIEALETEDIQGNPTVVKSLARDLGRGGETVMKFSNVRYDVGLTDSVFEERFLRRPPMQWLK